MTPISFHIGETTSQFVISDAAARRPTSLSAINDTFKLRVGESGTTYAERAEFRYPEHAAVVRKTVSGLSVPVDTVCCQIEYELVSMVAADRALSQHLMIPLQSHRSPK